MKKEKFISFFLFFLVSLQTKVLAQDKASEILEFANWLFKESEYIRAAGEYYRYLYFNPEANQAEILYKIGRCYFKAKEYIKALDIYEKLLSEAGRLDFLPELVYETAYCHYKTANFKRSNELLVTYEAPFELKPPFLLLKAANWLALGELAEGAIELEDYLQTDGLDKAKALAIYNLIKKERPQLSPFWAGVFSAVIPGLGKIYAQRVEDGIVSFSLVVLCAGLAWYSFWRDELNSLMGWIYAGLGGLFYLANIWGSIVATLQFNSAQKAKLDWQIKEALNEILP